EIDLRAIDRQPAVVGIDPSPGFAVLPGKCLAGESSRTVVAEVEACEHALPFAVIRHVAPNMKPGRAPWWAPGIADLDGRELSLDGIGVADGLAPDAEGRQLERRTRFASLVSLLQCWFALKPRPKPPLSFGTRWRSCCPSSTHPFPFPASSTWLRSWLI